MQQLFSPGAAYFSYSEGGEKNLLHSKWCLYSRFKIYIISISQYLHTLFKPINKIQKDLNGVLRHFTNTESIRFYTLFRCFLGFIKFLRFGKVDLSRLFKEVFLFIEVFCFFEEATGFYRSLFFILILSAFILFLLYNKIFYFFCWHWVL